MAGFLSEGQVVGKKKLTSTPKCGACGLSKTCYSPKMGSFGKGKKKILIIGSSPTKNEDSMGDHLVGETGKLLKDTFKKLGIDIEEDCIKTNAVLCHSEGSSKHEIENQVECCRPLILKEIKDFQPNVIILLGISAVQSVIGHELQKKVGEIKKWIGWNIPSRTFNAWICPTFDLSFVLEKKDKVLQDMLYKHLSKAVELADKKPWKEIPNEEKEIRIVPEKKAIRLIKEYRRGGGVIAFDYETTGLKPDLKEHEIISCSICWNGEETIAFMMTEAIEKDLIRLLHSPRTRKIAANLKFEHRWTKVKLNTEIKGWWWDTMLAGHVLDNRSGITSIKFQSYIHFGINDYDSHISSYLKAEGGNGFNNIKKLHEKDLLLYNGMDSLLEYKVAVKQMREMGHPFPDGDIR